MNTKFNIFFVMGIGLLMLIAGQLMILTGKIPECNTEPYTWYDNFFVFVGISTLFVLGYLSGRNFEE